MVVAEDDGEDEMDQTDDGDDEDDAADMSDDEEDEEDEYEDEEPYYHALTDMPAPSLDVATGFAMITHPGEMGARARSPAARGECQAPDQRARAPRRRFHRRRPRGGLRLP